jgi:hypothetical protein
VFAAAGAPLLVLALLLFNGVDLRRSMLLASVALYAGWASYWGIAGTGGLLAGAADDEAGSRAVKRAGTFVVRHAGIWGVVGVPILLGLVHGNLGGGVYEFLRFRRIARDPASAVD